MLFLLGYHGRKVSELVFKPEGYCGRKISMSLFILNKDSKKNTEPRILYNIMLIN